MKRLSAAEPFTPGALNRLLDAVGAPAKTGARLSADPAFAVFQRGGLAPRASIARLRKALIAAQLETWVDHRSGIYATAKRRAGLALEQERRAGARIMLKRGGTDRQDPVAGSTS